MIQIKTSYLKGALMVAGVKDVRYYLNGVFLEIRAGIVRIAGTDGHSALYAYQNIEHSMPPIDVIVPRDTLALVLKNKPKDMVTLALTDSGWSLNGLPFTPVDGKFPDVRRVIPAAASGVAAKLFDPAIYSNTLKGVLAACDERGSFRVEQNGQDAAVVRSTDPAVLGIFMPMRIRESERDTIGDYTGYGWGE
jgi:DNA polymerase-3 subunit beta